ncbi:MAG: phytanoyl-CoA dioxygenase family protein [Bacteroidetes bacterium]|nr:phytanoyl-CoA dioxygenase family protein [Bacteroidota bacterium]MDA1120048.1 phytanoyl-CoA dioxygenase family protein [Bacteroidota bacterium]
MSTLREQFQKDGYVIVDVLSESEISDFRTIMDNMLSESKRSSDSETHSAALQHLGDEISDFGNENRQYYFHLLTKPGTQPIHHAFYHQSVLNIVEKLIGPRLIVNNASILASNPGVSYKLGWHRDVIQIPEDEIEDRLFSADRFHNSVQINLPLVQEDSLEIVPGSHNRPNSEAENQVFAGTKHYTREDAKMPGAMKVSLKAGRAVFYNNNLIHRGYCVDSKVPRRTLHMGYHSATKPPTWHFYLLNGDLLTPEYLVTLSPRMRQMMEEYLECRRQYPRMEDTWKEGYGVEA